MGEAAGNPGCPRCGYDLSGHVRAWGESCPVEGVCPECGLEFWWGDVMRPDLMTLRGLFEHARGWRQSVGWACRTWLMALRPHRFWSRVRMHHLIVPRRLVAWPLVFASAVYILTSVMGTASEFVWDVKTGARGGTFVDIMNVWLRPLGWYGLNQGRMVHPLSTWNSYVAAAAAATIAMPLVFLALPVTRARAKVRSAHVLRAASYSLAWLAIPLLASVLKQADELLAVILATRRGWYSSFDVEAFITRAWWLLAPALLAWILWWWWCFLTRGIELPQPRRHFFAIAVVGLLAAVVALSLSWEMTWWLAGLW